jgi:hypothetical protein
MWFVSRIDMDLWNVMRLAEGLAVAACPHISWSSIRYANVNSHRDNVERALSRLLVRFEDARQVR